MRHLNRWIVMGFLTLFVTLGHAGSTGHVVDLSSRPGVTQRMLVFKPAAPKAALVMLPGGENGYGQLAITTDGRFKGEGPGANVVQRARDLFVAEGVIVVLVDAPSDRQQPPYLGGGFRVRPEHAHDLKAVIAWIKQQTPVPVWLMANCAGAYSAISTVARLGQGGGPDGLVLSSTQMGNDVGEPGVLTLPGLARVQVPVLVIHHERDGCSRARPADLPKLMDKLSSAPVKELITLSGGRNVGDPCESEAYHGFNGLDGELVKRVSAWVLAH